MNAYQLHKPDGTPANAFACGECGQVWIDADFASRCCTCGRCGKESDRRGLGQDHDECWRANRAKRDAETLAKAELLPSWDGWVYCEGYAGGNDGYYESLDDFIDHLSGDVPESEWPERVHVCKTNPFPGANIGRVIEDVTVDMFDDAAERLEGVDELDAAIRKFNEANKHLVSYLVDYKRAVAVPKLAAEQAGEETK